MKAIRGEITIDRDTPDDIKIAVKELLEQICTKNRITEENMIYIMFSNTADIYSHYPAKAAREAGFFNVPLFSSLEPEIENALKKCIRVLVLTESELKTEHVYLRKAANLRKDLSSKLNIALDGPAGSGKSTVAKKIAEKFNILYLDTGAMYRACALKFIKLKIDVKNESEVKKIINQISVSVEYIDGTQHTFLDGIDVSDELRTNEISMAASTVSAHERVRNKMVESQRNIAKNMSCVLDGRDIGTNVLPDAPFKFYLTARPEIRAKRRLKENLSKGLNDNFENVLADIIKRDEQDKNRSVAPLKVAQDAILVDTSDMSIDQVVNYICSKIQEKI